MTASCLFVTHGAPTLAIQHSPARRFLTEWGASLDGARAVIVLSAHWQAPQVAVSFASALPAIHDFHGFPEALYQLSYPAAGDPALAHRVVDALATAGMRPSIDHERGLDHGAWMPLMLMRPKADLPIIPVSILADAGTEAHYRLGQALRPLRDQGVAILASGSLTHNLGLIGGHDDAPSDWSEEFADWFADRVAKDDRAALLDYRRQAPHAPRAHPEDDHLMPFFAALGAGGVGQRCHHSTTYQTLAMDDYSFA